LQFGANPVPRQVRDSNLESRTARGRLKVRKDPYFRLIEQGLHVGYRKLVSGPGTWVRRQYDGERYRIENLRTPDGRLIIADDYADADGVVVMNFAQAQATLRQPLAAQRIKQQRYTVADAIADYLAAKAADGRDIGDATSRTNLHILPVLGDRDCVDLTTEALRKWHRNLANSPPRRRTRSGDSPNYGDRGDKRRRQASANRVLTILKAALNHAFADGKVASDSAWRKLRAFRGVESARVRYLTVAEAQRLMNACEPNFRPLVHAALLTGARYGQLVALCVADFNADVGTLHMRSRKGSGHEREHYVTLTEEGVGFFRAVCAGRHGRELIFRNGDRPWRRSEQKRPMHAASEHARITPPVSFHVLRHTWASLAVMNGVPLLVVAKSLGHSDTRMVERHYGHLAPSYIADAIRAGAPRFGVSESNKVQPLH
jgi:integrase